MHQAEVIKIQGMQPHPNADTLSLIRIGDFHCVVRSDDWKDGDLVIYIEPDTIVPENEKFKFLGERRRIKVRKLRGCWSAGLIIPAPLGAKVGDDYFEKLGLIHYEPQSSGNFTTGGENTKSPKGFYPIYNIDNFRRYSHLFEDGEEVIVTEKTHGISSRYVCVNDILFCGSRKNWKKKDPNNLWWKALSRHAVLEAWLRHHPDLAVYGEVFGQVQSLKYGATNDDIFFAAFDILKGDRWLDFDEAHEIGAPLPWVPLVYRGPFDKEKILAFAEEDSTYPGAKNIREGVVVKPVHERIDRRIGRVQLKIVGNKYLSKS